MKTWTRTLMLCTAALMPVSAAAVPPETDGCAVAIDNAVPPQPVEVVPGVPFDVVVRPQPGSGQWFSPTITVEVVAVPLGPPEPPASPESWSQTVTQSFGGGLGGPNKATAQLLIPYDPVNANVPVFDYGQPATVTATVSEPLSNRKYRVAVCTLTATVLDPATLP